VSLYPMYKVGAQILTRFPESVRKWTMNRVIRYILNRFSNITVEGEEHILWAKQNPCIIACNHLSNADGLVLNEILNHRFNLHVRFLAGVKLQHSIFSSLALESVPHIAIHPDSPDRQAIKEAVNTVKGGAPILIFPEGGRSRTGQLIEGKKGVMLIQKLSKAPILPMALIGTEKLMPINDEDMSMETFHHANIRIVAGKPFTPTPGETDDIDYLMRQIADLLPPEYQGVYRQ
jgi:1-acyl-sn-glycerol-3-phosphate acyltransferase